jgi:hypothetical protein
MKNSLKCVFELVRFVPKSKSINGIILAKRLNIGKKANSLFGFCTIGEN